MYHTTIEEDPDVRAAVQAFRPTVLEIRARSATLIGLKEGSPARGAEQDAIEDLTSGMRLRARRLDLSLDALFRLVNDDLRASPPPVDHRPTGQHLRVLEAEMIRATSEEACANDAVEAAQRRLRGAVAARIEAQRACAGYVADRALA